MLKKGTYTFCTLDGRVSLRVYGRGTFLCVSMEEERSSACLWKRNVTLLSYGRGTFLCVSMEEERFSLITEIIASYQVIIKCKLHYRKPL